uniref:Replication stress response regulator SDE2 n=1 Tax=Monopterus albus TaxID=43700 RepID=A0A3Q3IYD8_MONAL
MEVFVSFQSFRFSNLKFPEGSVVRDVLQRFPLVQRGVSAQDFYIIRNGRLSDLEEPLQHGAVYHLEPRLCGGKGGFGSMLRALGAQIEKTTNREACRDLSGRRLRDVNHEKEMAEWLKKQAEREAEKEQRRLERLQRKLSEPKHQFTDPEYQQQCHDLSERLEDSVLKGLQAASSGQVQVDEVSVAKRPNLDQSEQPQKKKKKMEAAAACFWTGVDELLSSEDEDDDSPSTSSSNCGAAALTVMTKDETPSSTSCATAVTMTTQRQEVEPEQNSSSSPACDRSSSSTHQTAGPSEEQRPSESPQDQTAGPSEEQRPSESPQDQTAGPPESPQDQTARPPESPEDQTAGPSAEQNPQVSGPLEVSSCWSQQQQRGAALDLSSVVSVHQLEALGLDALKEELMLRGLKCGGTLAERAARLFSIRGLTPDQIDSALLTKPGKIKRK